MTKDLVLLHGGSHGSWCWAPLLEALPEHAGGVGRIIALDMPGAGTKRGRNVAGLSIEDVVKELNDDLRGQGVKDAVLVGHSIAGALMPMMMLEDPSLFAEAIFLATAVPADGQSINQLMGQGLHGQNPDEVGFPVNPATTPPAELFGAMFSPDLTEAQMGWLMGEIMQDVTPPAVALGQTSWAGFQGLKPSTYVVTLRDPILPPAWQRRFAERLGCERVVELDTPHEPFVSHPALLATLLRDLLA